MIRKNNRGQSTLEITLLAVVVIGALLAIQIYVKHAVEGKIRKDVDSIAEQFDIEKTTITDLKTESWGTTIRRTGIDVAGGEVPGQTLVTQTDTNKKTGTETVGTWEE